MDKIRSAIEKAIEKEYSINFEVNLTAAPEGTGADYATNVAMQLAKIVHRPPMVIAEALADVLSSRISSSESAAAPSPDVKSGSVRCSTLPRTSSKIASSAEPEGERFTVEVAAPGFLNFKLNGDYFRRGVAEFAKEVKIPENVYAGKTVVAEFSDPNPFKVLHVGHFYTSVVGDSISRLLELGGARVVRANFGGDVGLHVAKTLYSLIARMGDSFSERSTLSNPPVRALGMSNTVRLRASDSSRSSSQITSSGDCDAFQNVITNLTIEDVAKAYVEGTRAYEEDETAKAEITELNKEIYRINAEDLHDTELAKLYWRGRELSYEYFEDFYAKIGVRFDKFYPESTVAGRGLKEVSDHIGSVYEESDGAVVYHGEKVGLHTRVFINRECVPTYEAKDVGLIFTKWDDWHFDESVVVTGNEQTDYMKVVLASVSEYAPKLVERTTHLTHGLVKLPGNVKMSSRKGNFLKAVDVLEIVQEALGGERADRKVVLAAIKYAFLKYKMGGDIIFDPAESVSTTGNSGVYLLYSAVRAKKILQKQVLSVSDALSARDAGGHDSSKESSLSSPKKVSIPQDDAVARTTTVFERNLGKKVVQYREVVQEAIAEKAPNKICTYLYELAQEFSRFYENVKVAGSEREGELVQIVRAYLNVMEHGLGILGIEVPEGM